MDACDMNMAALLKTCARELLKEDLETARSIDAANITVPENALRRVRRMIRDYEKESWWDSVPVTWRRIVAAILIACTASFGMCISVEAVRAEIVNTILQWCDQFVAVFYVTKETPPSVIEEYREPTLQIAGTEKQIIVQTEGMYQTLYLLGDEICIIYQQVIISDESINIDGEDGCVQKTVKVRDYTASLFEYKNGNKTLMWYDREYTYIIYSFLEDIEADTLILIAESIQ